MAMEIDPVWPTPQDCRHRHHGDFFQPTQPRYLMQLTVFERIRMLPPFLPF